MSAPAPDPDLGRNLRLYGIYAPLAGCLFWSPVFFLYLAARFPMDAILLLHSFYYFAVVIAEVPSGYLSDRVGRVLTLRLAAAAAAVAHTLFLLGEDRIGWFVAAQAGLALHFAFRSGTEASFHYDTLAAQGLGGHFADREARIQRNRFLAAAAGAVAGGAVAVVDLRLAYALSLLAAGGLFALTLAMREPPRRADEWATLRIGAQLRACAAQLRSPFLLWVFGYVVLQTTLEHVPYELAQPYVAAVLGEPASAVSRTPLATGLVNAAIAFVGAWAASRTVALRRRLGTGGVLLAITGVQTALIGVMAFVFHPVVVPLIALRSVQPAIGHVVVDAAVAPRVPRALRATYLSLQSLAGRLGYSGVLAGLAAVAGAGATADPATLATLLRTGTLLAVAGLALLLVTRRPEPAEPDGPADAAGPTGAQR